MVMELAKSIVVKRQDLADKHENLETIKNFEVYKSLMMGGDIDKILHKYEFYTIMDVITTNPVLARYYQENPDEIPPEEREIVRKWNVLWFTEQYEEKNNYYKMLMGVPETRDDFAIMVDIGDPELLPYVGLPIHTLDPWVIEYLWNHGGMKILIEKYPNYKYLNYLGKHSIGFYEARNAKHLDILWYDPNIDIPEELKTKFFEEYYIQRNFHLNLLYDPELFLFKDLYSGFIGFLILIAAIRGTLMHDIAELRTDEEYVNAVLKSYDLYDYFEDMYLEKKIQIIRNIDELLKYSGSDKVLISVAKLFGYNTKITRYHLMKTHNKNHSGEYIFPKKPNGEPDYNAMYDLKFLKVDVSSDIIDINEANMISFDEVTERDELWHLDKSYKEEIKKEDFNIDLSKYVSIENSYDLTDLVFELAYFLNFLVDNSNNIKHIKQANDYAASGMSDLFTYIMFFFCVVAKKNNFNGNIYYEPDEMGRMLKYNIGVNFDQIEAINKKYKLGIKPEDFLYYHENRDLSMSGIKKKYGEYSEIYRRLKKIMDDETDYDRYKGMVELKNLLFTHFCLVNVFMKPDGNVCETYMDKLKELDISLYKKVQEAEGEELAKMNKYVIAVLDEMFHSVDLNFLFLNTPDTQDPRLIGYFKKMVNLVLSSATTLDTFNILYTIKNNDSAARIFDKVNYRLAMRHHENVEVIDKIKNYRKIIVRDGICIKDHLRIES